MSSTPTFTRLELELEPPLARLTLNRPDRLNALDPQLLEELGAAAAFLDTARAVRAVVVAGRGRAFCAGFDLDAFGAEGVLSGDWADRFAAADLGSRTARAIEAMRPVTVAALHGHVVGGGVVLAAACDLRVAAQDTVFSIPEIDLGIPLAWGGIPRLVRELGPATTKELVMTCRAFGPEEAAARGFLNRVVGDAEAARATATELAGAVAARPEVPVTLTKRAVDAVVTHASGAAFSFGDAASLLAALGDPESASLRAAYLRDRREAR